MSILETSQYSTNANVKYGWYDGRKAGVIREKVAVTAAAKSTLKSKLPASTRRYWAVLHYGTAPSFTWAQTHNSPTGAVALIDIAPTSISTSNVMLTGSTTLSANSKLRGKISTSCDQSTTTSEVTLYLAPYAATTSASNTAVVSTSYAFAATCDVYVTVWFEKFDDSADV